MALISLLLPTRDRPESLTRFLASLAAHTKNLAQIEVILYIDEDDIKTQAVTSDTVPLKKIIGPRKSMGAYNTACYEHAQGDIIFLVNDDIIVQTPAWDELLIAQLNAIPDGIFLAYPNDLFKKSKLATFPILSRKVCELLVDPFPKAYKGAFIDSHLLDIFKRLEQQSYPKIFYLESIVFEHMHYRLGKAKLDATYQNRSRFVDDFPFVQLTPWRQEGASRLLHALKTGGTTPSQLPALTIEKPKHFFAALCLYINVFLKDPNLPLSERFFLFKKHCLRDAFARLTGQKI